MSKNQKNKTLVGTALLASLASIGIHLYLALEHYQQKLGVDAGESLCNINAHFDCRVVAVSKFASLFGYPIALWGAATHLVLSLFLLLWFVGLLQDSSRLLRFATWIGIFIGGMSLVMGSISSFGLGTYCLFCIFTYALSFVIAGCLLATSSTGLFPNLGQDFKSLITTQKWIAVSIILIPVITVFSGKIVVQTLLGESGEEGLNSTVAQSVNSWGTKLPKVFNESQGLILQADQGPAKVTIVEFADFLCPHCKVLAEPMHNFVLAHPGVRLIYKPFPLDGVCNGDKIPKRDGVRCELAYATFCAESLFKKGWAAHADIFAHQMDWTQSEFKNQIQAMSKRLSIESDPLLNCMKTSEVHQLTMSAANEGADIMGTPTVFVNGKELPNGNIMPVLEAAVNSISL